MRPATLPLYALLALAFLSTGAAFVPPPVLAAGGLPEERYLIIIGAIVLIAGGALGGLHNLLKVLEYFRLKRQGELASNNGGMVSREDLNDELARVYDRIEERDKRLEDKIDRLATTSGTLATNVATALTAIGYLRDLKLDGPKHPTGKAVPRG
jgi:hypothetical protein